MNAKEFEKQLEELDACRDFRIWAKGKTRVEAWKRCKRADWLLWYASKIGIDRKIIIGLACDCAELVLPYVKEGENRPRIAIETARRWIKGEAGIQEVRDADDAATAAADDAATAAATAAAYASAYAAKAIDATAYASATAATYAAKAVYAAAIATIIYAADATTAADDAYAIAYAKKNDLHIRMCRMIRKKIRMEK